MTPGIVHTLIVLALCLVACLALWRFAKGRP